MMLSTIVCVILIMIVSSSAVEVTPVKAINTVKVSSGGKHTSKPKIGINQVSTKNLKKISRSYGCSRGYQIYRVAYSGESRIIFRKNGEYISQISNPSFGARIRSYCLKQGDVLSFEAHRWNNHFGVAVYIENLENRWIRFKTDTSRRYGFKAKELNRYTKWIDMTSRVSACTWKDPVFSQPKYSRYMWGARYVWAWSRANGYKPQKILLRKKIGSEC